MLVEVNVEVHDDELLMPVAFVVFEEIVFDVQVSHVELFDRELEGYTEVGTGLGFVGADDKMEVVVVVLGGGSVLVLTIVTTVGVVIVSSVGLVLFSSTTSTEASLVGIIVVVEHARHRSTVTILSTWGATDEMNEVFEGEPVVAGTAGNEESVVIEPDTYVGEITEVGRSAELEGGPMNAGTV